MLVCHACSLHANICCVSLCSEGMLLWVLHHVCFSDLVQEPLFQDGKVCSMITQQPAQQGQSRVCSQKVPAATLVTFSLFQECDTVHCGVQLSCSYHSRVNSIGKQAAAKCLYGTMGAWNCLAHGLLVGSSSWCCSLRLLQHQHAAVPGFAQCCCAPVTCKSGADWAGEDW